MVNGEAVTSMPASIAHSMPTARLLGSRATWRSALMAVALEGINFIGPFSVIRKKDPGGLVQCLLDYRGFVGSGPIWFDEHLFRDGAMNDLDII